MAEALGDSPAGIERGFRMVTVNSELTAMRTGLAGDLATASFTGSQLGTAILWAVVVGGFLKFVLTEGLARWQLVTGQTFLEIDFNVNGRRLGNSHR